MQLHLENPMALLGFIAVAVLAWTIWQKRHHGNGIFSVRHLIFTLVAFSLCILGLARPQLGRKVAVRQGVGYNLFLAIDISNSMLSEDIRPSRLAFATSAIQILFQNLPGARVAVFPFAADGYIQIPLTNDLDAISSVLPTLSPSMTTDQGTDLSQAMDTLWQQILKMEKKTLQRGENWLPTQVILFSDGESHHDIKKDIFHRFRARNIPIHTIGTGTLGGGPIPAQQTTRLGYRSFLAGKHLKDSKGKVVHSLLNPKPMKQISALTGGSYFGANLDALQQLGNRLSQHQRVAKVTTSLKVDREYYPVLFILAFILFLIEFGLGRWEYAIRSLLVPLLLFSSLSSFASNSEQELLKKIENATDSETKSILTYNLGVSHFQNKNLEKAAEYFLEAGYLAQDPALKKKTLFNLGNTMLHLQQPQQAIQAYQEAFEIKTQNETFDEKTNQDLSENMALAALILQMAQKQSSPQSGNQDKQDGKRGNQSKDPRGPKKDYEGKRFSQARKQRIFDLIASEEQQIIQRLQKKQNRSKPHLPQHKRW